MTLTLAVAMVLCASCATVGPHTNQADAHDETDASVYTYVVSFARQSPALSPHEQQRLDGQVYEAASGRRRRSDTCLRDGLAPLL